MAPKQISATFHAPTVADGMALHRLIATCPPLDTNSMYCNLLQCTHFSATSIVARHGEELVGAISGYLLPDDPHTLFVWQVCVSQRAQGQGIASKLIAAVLARASSTRVRYLACTITEDNTASWGLFGSVARALKAQMRQAEHFLRDTHFDDGHDSELAVSIGPFTQERVADLSA